MSVNSKSELLALQAVSEAVARTLRQMIAHAQVGISTQELDEYGFQLLSAYGANPAPKQSYGFPGYTCISVNHEVAHGIPSPRTILQEGDLVNVDVSAELDGYYGDNGASFVLGKDIHNLQPLVNASKVILRKAIGMIRGGVRIRDMGRLVETESRKAGFRVIKNLSGHGIGRQLHEAPNEIPSYYDRFNLERFRKSSVVAIETFISTRTSYVQPKGDGWTLITRDGSYVAQHEHTVVVSDGTPLILTAANGF
ncbi:MAG: type I methionyl aminopeptidase [Bacteroidia bacterium]|nr:type I methionyl aminopeptidase [Bacteroidia bacterium]